MGAQTQPPAPAAPTHANRLLAQQSDRDGTGQPFGHSVDDTSDGDSVLAPTKHNLLQFITIKSSLNATSSIWNWWKWDMEWEMNFVSMG